MIAGFDGAWNHIPKPSNGELFSEQLLKTIAPSAKDRMIEAR